MENWQEPWVPKNGQIKPKIAQIENVEKTIMPKTGV